jgi:hypothetical protein
MPEAGKLVLRQSPQLYWRQGQTRPSEAFNPCRQELCFGEQTFRKDVARGSRSLDRGRPPLGHHGGLPASWTIIRKSRNAECR